MRVSFSIPLKPLSGKHKFAIRLAAAFKAKGVKVTDKEPHVNFVFIKGVRKGCKNIFRLDGVWMNSEMGYRKKNKKLRRIMEECEGIIYQNDFCKEASDNFLGEFRSHAVILNGAPLSQKGDIYRHTRPYLLTFCRWRPHKRLKATVKGFLRSGLSENYDLLVLGKDPDYVKKHPAVIYKGNISEGLRAYIRGCKFVVHLAYIDWCPNSVVEALACGKNVLHGSTGGTKYVVRDNGIRVDDRPWDFTPTKLYKPPALDDNKLSEAFNSMMSLSPPEVKYLDINVIADQYINYCREIV